ncbi:MAG: 16S rRNA (adenine(1518)-N(6)/adenine(1519)-N(6))-dimethyltransferase RsmA [Phycisphaerales bacterium]|nr:16S rRNA (adenine(1518)-N(6)/adenine(1519)-N(6))-dimethyltransferase RsmA [Phycisphaerales bacterium]
MQTLTEIKALLAAHGVRPRHRLGQNFLHDHNQLQKIVAAGELAPGDLVLEVGPGTGTLTEALVESGAEVIACELDPVMATIVQDRLGDRVRIHQGDCLDKTRHLAPELLGMLEDRPFKLVANLPYQAATPLLMDLLIRRDNCMGQVALIQQEVADRLLAASGSRVYGPISVLTALLGEARKVSVVPPGCFWPQPKVTSAVIQILPRPDHGIADAEAFADFVGSVFRTRRKQLGTILGRDSLPGHIDPTHRPEQLGPQELQLLFENS